MTGKGSDGNIGTAGAKKAGRGKKRVIEKWIAVPVN